MATFRFTFELGTDDATLPVGEALYHVDALREWLSHYPIRKFGTVFVSEVEINPTDWDTGYEARVFQGGFPVLDVDNVAEALYGVFGHRPKIDQLRGIGQGIWHIPIPRSLVVDLALGKTVWTCDDLMVELVDF